MVRDDLTNEQYHDMEGVSSSTLKSIHAKSVLHSKVKFTSDAMAFGTLVHTLVLEPHKSDYVVMPKFDRRTKVGKAEHAEWTAAHSDKNIVEQADMDKAQAMRDSIYENSEWNNLLMAFDAQIEHSAFSNIDGTKTKCRPDWYSKSHGLMVDLKTTKNAHPRAFRYDLFKCGYDMQVPFYQETWQEAGGGDVDQFLFLAVESFAPFDFTVHALTADQHIKAWQKCLDALAKYNKARYENIIEGYSKEVNYVEEY